MRQIPVRGRIANLGIVLALWSALGTLAGNTASWAYGALRRESCTAFGLESDRDHGVVCGYVKVPLRHSEPKGATIELAVVIVEPPAASPDVEPVLVAQGVPGEATIKGAMRLLNAMPPTSLARKRALVFWDQRGTGFSKPALNCLPERNAGFEGTKPNSAEPAGGDAAEVLRACGERLRRTIGDLLSFNPYEGANDIDDLQRRLGFTRINLYAHSYGTVTAQYLMRQHPQILRSVILDAVIPVGLNFTTEIAFIKERVAREFFDGCRMDAKCNAAYPDLGARFATLIERLDRDPVTLQSFPRGMRKEPVQVQLTGRKLEHALFQSIYSGGASSFIPYPPCQHS